jgi:hypothetical protein
MACVVAGLAPKNRPGTAPTLVSQVHVTAAVLAGALLLGAMALVSRCGITRTIRRATLGLALVTGSAAGVFRLAWGTHVYGLSERVLLGLGMGWLSALAGSALMVGARADGTLHERSARFGRFLDGYRERTSP